MCPKPAAIMQFSEQVARFAEVTTLHGVKDLFWGENKVLRFVWSIVLSLATGLLVYEVVQITQTFLKEPIATNIQLQKMTRLQMAKIITPYVCVSDWMSKSQVEKNYTQEQLLALDSFSNQQTGALLSSNASMDDSFQTGALKWFAKKWIQHYQNEMLTDGTMLEDYYEPIMKKFPFLPPRNDTRFLKYMIFLDGVCFPVLLDSATDVVGVPIYRGEIDLLQEDTVTELRELTHWQKAEISLIFYHGVNMRYVSEIDRLIINFTVDSEPSQLNLRMIFRQLRHLPRRSIDCHEYPDVEQESKFPVDYGRQICMQGCMDTRVYYPKYGCTFRRPRMRDQANLTYPKHKPQYHLCTAEKFYFAKDFTEAESSATMQCQDFCERLYSFCKEWDIETVRMRWVPPRTCKKHGCLNLAIVAQPTLEVSEEILLMSFETLLSNLGGQAGLWFGGSILSIVQLIFFCARYFSGRCVNSGKKLQLRLHHEQRQAPVSTVSRYVDASTSNAVANGFVNNFERKRNQHGIAV